jgi:flavin reductase (DIM6/NTAB) family NADH-FMN oxidoreductase RutF
MLCVARAAASLPAVEQAERYAVHILHDRQRHISRAFARSAAGGAQKFAEVAWRPDDDGLPLLDEYLARVECTVIDRVELGDHVAYVGRVDAAHAAGGVPPLAFFRGQYGRMTV